MHTSTHNRQLFISLSCHQNIDMFICFVIIKTLGVQYFDITKLILTTCVFI